MREAWIDAVLGHEGDGGKSLGIVVYLKRIGVRNLVRVVEGIHYPMAVDAAFRDLMSLAREQHDEA